ncbi:hypothetical protein EYF80_049619 [Liparis tanakae]|uniref:Uncharacterized protein n=1 Tax=Liparis tanakae TaxID=230148 RepID=A0A4Z2FGC1_9TELE|nr:hypothetical protein EYF80_049619 [Liparis tanakae]
MTGDLATDRTHSASPSAEKSRPRNLAICGNGEDPSVIPAEPPATVTCLAIESLTLYDDICFFFFYA